MTDAEHGAAVPRLYVHELAAAGTEPPVEEIPAMSREHVAALEASSSEDVWVVGGRPFLVLETVGRRSGRVHKVALPCWIDPEVWAAHPVVVASFSGGPRHPAWYLNLGDRRVNPDVVVRLRDHSYRSVPEILEGAEYEVTWGKVAAGHGAYDRYRSRTARTIPLVRFPPSS